MFGTTNKYFFIVFDIILRPFLQFSLKLNQRLADFIIATTY